MAERNHHDDDDDDDDRSDIKQRETATKSTTPPIESVDAAADADSGGGAGAGIPDGDLAARAGDAVTRGDVRQDREKMFPDEPGDAPQPGSGARE